MPRLAVFPKCYLDDIIVNKRMKLTEWINLAANLDIDGLEMHDLFFKENDQKFCLSIRKQCERLELAIPMMCFSPDFTQPELSARKYALKRQKQAIDLTVLLGGKICRTLSGQNRPGIDRKKAIGWCVEMIREAAAYAQGKEILLAIENHYKDNYWTYPEFALKSDIFLKIVSQIDSPAFGVNFDPSNAIIGGEDPIKLLEEIKERVISMHASDRYLEGGTIDDLHKLEAHPVHGYAHLIKHGVIGKGLNDYDKIFSILQKAGFDGWISIEDGINGFEEIRESVQFLKKKIKQYF